MFFNKELLGGPGIRVKREEIPIVFSHHIKNERDFEASQSVSRSFQPIAC